MDTETPTEEQWILDPQTPPGPAWASLVSWLRRGGDAVEVDASATGLKEAA